MYNSHPWYSQVKRKRSFEDSALNTKRPRTCLLNSFAQMSLNHQRALVDVEMNDEQSPPHLRDIKMKTPSWYESEPNRIVITSLDSSSDEEEDDNQPTVSPAVLQRIRSPLLPTPATQSQALVLYKPLVVVPKTEEKPKNTDAMDVE